MYVFRFQNVFYPHVEKDFSKGSYFLKIPKFLVT